MKLGLSSYSLARAIQANEMSITDAVVWIANHGGEHIEIVPIGFDLTNNPGLIEKIRKQADESGIEISNYAIGANLVADDETAYENEIQRVMKEVDVANALGVKLMRHDVASRSDISIKQFQADLPKLAEACQRIADYAAQYGITTSVENHGYYIQASDRVQALIHAVNRPNFKTTLDIGNFMCADEDSVAATKNNISYASMVHIKDFYWRPSYLNPGSGWFRTTAGNYLRGAISGQGDIDMREVLRVVKHSGYDGYLSIEFEGMEDCRIGSEYGLQNVRRLWDEA
ncbi:sugar phosphate isomerase/epimerase family protein [Paenibacillus spongiae]|uniref:Sugar phosphate isomerase/epimerase n=1 Tax=Paenibacillus spongiae TaxID=2909671 RepID=A0ABY5S1K6_9BACL|nr:sugar phosphate isomerase/epimerase family protein [Paenibacillus spongiae]UVI27509.1 sugar phosphate isomerase/epimerase [Paenibacillus spongiae]